MPDAIRTDHGVPTSSTHALYELSRRAVRWLRLGIGLERIAPGHPEQDGHHDRLHITLKTEPSRPAVANVLQQQACFDAFTHSVQPRTAAPSLGHGAPRQSLHPSGLGLPRPRVLEASRP